MVVATPPAVEPTSPDWFRRWVMRLPDFFVSRFASALSAAGPAPQLELTDTATVGATSTVKIADNTGSPYEQWVAGSGIVNRYYDAPNHVFRSRTGTEWGRITSAGLGIGVGVGGWSSDAVMSGQQGASSGWAVSAYYTGSLPGSGSLLVRVDSTAPALGAFYYTSSRVGSITTNGSATAFNTTSDEQLKTFDGAYAAADAVALIRADPVRRFTWNEHSAAQGVAAVGWGAQTSYAVSSDLATMGHGAPGDEGYCPWGVDQSKRTPYLWAALGAEGGVLDRLDALEARMDAVEAAIAGKAA